MSAERINQLARQALHRAADCRCNGENLDWDALHAAINALRDAALAAQPAQPAPSQPVAASEVVGHIDGGKWNGAEYWMPLAWELCAEENGEDACNELVWEGGPIPEPWGDRWLKYEDEAKRLIALVREHAPSALSAPQPAAQPQAVDDADKVDAERYRWLLEHAADYSDGEDGPELVMRTRSADWMSEISAAIDKAIKNAAAIGNKQDKLDAARTAAAGGKEGE